MDDFINLLGTIFVAYLNRSSQFSIWRHTYAFSFNLRDGWRSVLITNCPLIVEQLSSFHLLSNSSKVLAPRWLSISCRSSLVSAALQSISPTFYERNCTNCLAYIKCLTFTSSTKKLCAKLSYKKAVCKMLVKLTPTRHKERGQISVKVFMGKWIGKILCE